VSDGRLLGSARHGDVWEPSALETRMYPTSTGFSSVIYTFV
jgi:hypothetical protein